MTKSIKVLIAVLILIIIAGTYYIFHLKNAQEELPAENATTTVQVAEPGLTDEQLIGVTEDDEGKVLARGDLNGDKFEDAIVAETFCGASCSVGLAVILNHENKSAKLVENTHFDGYTAGTALQTDIQEVTIENGIISITGKGLDCGLDCVEERWNEVKTLKYQLHGNEIIQLPFNS